ncbi:DUF7260 family protein [Haloplanus natans]|uniref:DUF7260 family protein n=1 Tax=Haloplanus natans TaxID=376171 RepID=UPI000677FA05|nr:hypothetical protein [Haloplanus natans]
MNRHVLAPIGTALDRVADERAEVEAERDAFAAFVARVETCPARSEPSVTAPDPTARLRTTGLGADVNRTARLRRAYRETVMAVDHYDAVYGESLPVNVASEFGVDVATALCQTVPFTSALKGTLSDAATTAQAERERFDEILRRERRSLADAESALDDVVTAIRRRSTDHPDDATTPSLAELERRCDRIGTERQRAVQRQRRFSREGDALYEYLYGDQSWTYPVLSAVATLGEDLSAMRDGASDGAR